LESGIKSLLERAARLEDKTVSRFVLNSAVEQAKKTIHEHESLKLRAENAKIFFNALDTAISFNNKLTNALEENTLRVIGK
jgi:uncharacterized protein (DUF1778 family)